MMGGVYAVSRKRHRTAAADTLLVAYLLTAQAHE